MAKLTCALAALVVVVVCAEAIRIDTIEQLSEDRYINMRRNDPRCKGRTGMFGNPNDCRKYILCSKGNSKDKDCPGDFKFDSLRHCIPPKQNPDCKSLIAQHAPVDAEAICPEARGSFPLKSDCHKFISCVDFVPTIRNCGNGQFYSNMNGMCINYKRCPQQYSEEEDESSVCKRANTMMADENDCRRYTKCVNFRPMKKECPPGKAFEQRKQKCTRDYHKKCRNNSILSIEPSE